MPNLKRLEFALLDLMRVYNCSLNCANYNFVFHIFHDIVWLLRKCGKSKEIRVFSLFRVYTCSLNCDK